MAKCRKCGAEVPDGVEYCDNCKTPIKADESYLDSLLSSVMQKDAPKPQAPARRVIHNNIENSRKTVNNSVDKTEDFTASDLAASDSTGDSYDIMSSDDSYLNDIFGNDSTNDETDPFLLDEDELAELDDSTNTGNDIETADVDESLSDSIKAGENVDTIIDDSDKPVSVKEVNSTAEDFDVEAEIDKTFDENAGEDVFNSEESIDISAGDDSEKASVSDNQVPDVDEMIDNMVSKEETEVSYEGDYTGVTEYNEDKNSEPNENDDDIMKFWESINSDDQNEAKGTEESENSDDAGNKAETNNIDEANESGQSNESEQSNDTADDVFALEEPPEQENGEFDNAAEESATGDEDTDELLGIINASLNKNSVQDEKSVSKREDKPESVKSEIKETPSKKRGFFARLFGNIRQERTPEETEKLKEQALKKFDEDEKNEESRLEAQKADKEAKKKEKEEEAKAAAQKKKVDDKAKQEHKKEELEKKKELKDKKAQARAQLLAEIDANEGKINKAGTTVVFIVFAIVLAVIAIGTNVYTYRLSIQNATDNFEIQRYRAAYDEVAGLDIKEEDEEIYDKIMTVMYVNKHLEAYYYYQVVGMDAEALDSLMKGLMRYEKYVSYAAQLGISDDLDYVRAAILSELNDSYKLSETDAYELISYDDQQEYSAKIYDIIAQKER